MRREAKAAAAAVVVAAALIIAVAWPEDRAAPPDLPELAGAGRTEAPERAPVRALPGTGSLQGQRREPRSGGDAEGRTERERQALRLQRAERTLNEYRLATRYPPESRPASEHPDQMDLAQPERTQPFRDESNTSNEEDAALSVVLRQDRVFLSSDEAVTFTVKCVDRQGATQRCTISESVAMEAPHREGVAPLAPVAVVFNDEGREGDVAPGDGVHTLRFVPARSGFLASTGTLRVGVVVAASSARHPAFFDVTYTGAPPAAYTGEIREVVADGSLHLDVGLQVKKPGRYVITGRVDDAGGAPFAWVQFNDELPAGKQHARLTVFGKLIVDGSPAFPLRLRDVEGFLLHEQGDPDRELLPVRAGPVHTTRTHRGEQFSSAEWTSEQRERYLEELQKDVDEASDALETMSGP